MYELKVRGYFSAAHRLPITYSKCENLHGHNWKVEVSVIGKHLDKFGMLVDFGVLKKHLFSVIEKIDHSFLNELEIFNNLNPSSENIALFIANEMQGKIVINNLLINKVTVWESKDSSATYIVD